MEKKHNSSEGYPGTAQIQEYERSLEQLSLLPLDQAVERYSQGVSSDDMIAAYPSCDSTRINLVRMPEGCHHWVARRCGICDCFIAWQPKPGNTAKRSQQQELINQLLESTQLTHWEREFLQGLKGKRKLSPKQQQVLAKIEAELGGAQ